MKITEGYFKSKHKFQHTYPFLSQASIQKAMLSLKKLMCLTTSRAFDSLDANTNLEFRIR